MTDTQFTHTPARTAFEAWFADPGQTLTRGSTNEYWPQAAQEAWRVWEAGARHASTTSHLTALQAAMDEVRAIERQLGACPQTEAIVRSIVGLKHGGKMGALGGAMGQEEAGVVLDSSWQAEGAVAGCDAEIEAETFMRAMEERLDACEGNATTSEALMQIMAAEFCMNGRRLIAMARSNNQADARAQAAEIKALQQRLDLAERLASDDRHERSLRSE